MYGIDFFFPFIFAPTTEKFDTQLIKILEIKSGMIVADVGAGEGELTLRLAREVGLSGHVYANEIDVKAFLQYAKLRAYCSQTLKPHVFRAKVERGMYAGPDFVISNLRMKPLILYVAGQEPRDFLGGDCFYNLYKTKPMLF